MSFNKKARIFLPVLIFSVGFFLFLGQGKAFAGTVTSVFPRDNNWVLLSKYSCSGHCLQTPNASFRIFYDTTSSTYTSNSSFSVSVDVICRGGTSKPGAGMKFGSNGVKGWQSCGGRLSTSPDYTISQTLGKGALRTDGGGHGYPSRYAYADLSTKLGDGDPADTIIAIIVRANNGGKVTFQEVPQSQIDQSFGNSNNYTGHGSGPQRGPYTPLSSDGSGTAFALFQNTGGATYPRDFSTYFKTDCNLTSNQNVFLRWYDSDYGTSTQPFDLKFDLYDETSGSYVYQNYNGNLGGNDSYREIQFYIHVGHQYKWTWKNVASINGVQLWMPFSEFNRDIDCGTPAQGNITKAVCSTVVANNIKGENASGNITNNLPVKLRFHNGGPASAINTTYSGNSSGGRYSHATPSYVQNRTSNINVTVDLLVQDYSKPGNPYIQVDSATIGEPCDGGPTAATCPSIPVDPTDINLTGNSGKVPGTDFVSDPPTQYWTDPGLKPKDTVMWGNNRNSSNFQYVIQKITDQYGQDISTPSPHWSPQTQSANPFHVNWTPFINQYQYDSHSLTVTYTTYYPSFKYKATTAVYNSDGTIKGWKLTIQKDGGGNPVMQWNHTSPNDSESHPGNGNWAKAECYDRGFQVHDLGGSAALNGDNEDPTGANFSFTIPVNFFLPQGDTALRHPNKVCGLTYSANYYIKHADGSYGGGMPGHTSDSGPINSSDPSDCVGGNWADDVTTTFTKNYSTTLVPPMQAGDQICMSFSVAKGAGTMDENGSITSTSQPSLGSGEFCSERVVDKPYLHVYGADAIAGTSFRNGDTCSNPGNSRIQTYRSTDPAKSGSGVQFAALAFDQISGFGSASIRGSAPKWPTGLTFSNVAGIAGGDPTSPNDGGFYQGPAICVEDYYGTQTDPINTYSDSSVNITTSGQLQDGKQTLYTRGGANLDVYSNAADFNKQAAIFVDGNVVIHNNISMQFGKYIAIIAKGNIYVDKGVNRLDGLYVAQPRDDGSGGNIYTCSDGGSIISVDGLWNNCRSQLVINGAFVAQDVRFERVQHSIRDSSAREAPDFGTGQGTNAAEVFNFTPEIYLYTPIFVQQSNSQPYQYITTLAPKL